MTTVFNSNGNNKKFNENNNFDYKIDLTKYFATPTTKYHSDYTSDILNKIRSIFPWATKENDTSYTITLDNAPIESYTLLGVTPEALNLEWNKAASRLYDYIYYTENPSYDFIIGGIPVKIHGNYIQVGTKIIPKFTTSKFFNNLSKKEQIIIYNISININAISA